MLKLLRYFFAVLLFAGAILILIGLGTRTTRALRNGLVTPRTSVDLRADQNAVWLPSQCVNVHWETTNIVSVTLNGVPKQLSGEQLVCPDQTSGTIYSVGTFHPVLKAVYHNGDVRDFELEIEIVALNGETYILLVVAALIALLGAYLIRYPLAVRLKEWLVKSLDLPDEISSKQARLSLWMGVIFALINMAFAGAVIALFGSQPLWPALPFAVCGLALATAGLIPAVQWRASRLMQSNWMILAPIVWFMLSVTMLDLAMRMFDSPLWATVQSWHAMLFTWIGLFWGIAYAMRRFTFDTPRRFAWLTLVSLAVLIMIAALALPFLRWANGWSVRGFNKENYGNSLEEYPLYLVVVADQNHDAIADYVPATIDFPFAWRGKVEIVHRPVFQMATSQVCQTVDALSGHYDDGQRGCTIFSAVLAHWLTNFTMFVVCLVLIYELIRININNPRVAWFTAALASISVWHLWTLAIPSTDYSDFFIGIVGLWLLHTIFTDKHVTAGKVTLVGILFGLLLLIKLLPIDLMIGALLALILRRWRILLALAIVPLLVWESYVQLVQTFGISYMTIEASGKFPTLIWLWKELPHYTPSEVALSSAKSIGNIGQSIELVFGVLLVIGVVGALSDRRYSRSMQLIGWAAFVCSGAFNWVFTYTYVSHVTFLMPFIYGGTALVLDDAQTWLRARFDTRPHLATALSLSLWALAVIHNLAQWLTWTNKNPLAQ